MNKHTLLQQLSEQTESHLQLAISSWQMLPHSSFARIPAPNAWSANQCLQHLNGYGQYYLPLLEKALLTAKHQPRDASYKAGWLGAWFTSLMQTEPTTQRPKKPMKAAKQHSPTQILPSHEVIGEFIDQQERLLVLLQEAMNYNLGSARIPISIASFVKLKLGDVLTFLVAHNHRHVQQAMRALQHKEQAAPTH